MKRNLKPIILLVIGVSLGYVAATHGGILRRLASHVRLPARASSEAKARPAQAAGGDLLLGDFEQDEELSKRWESNGVIVSPTTEYATSGRLGAKLVFRMPPAAPAFMLEDYFSAHPEHANWTSYRYLAFDVSNPEAEALRLVLQLKDAKDRRYKQNLSIPPRQSKTFSVYLPGLAGQVDLQQVTQLNFFMWKPRGEHVLLLDRVRLLHGEPGQAEPASAPTASSPSSVPAASGPEEPYVLCDFESEQAAALWEFLSAGLTLTDQHVAAGTRAGRFEFQTGHQSSAAMIEDAFSKGVVPSDWSGYRSLRFIAYAEGPAPLRLMLQLKDGGGKRFKKNLVLPPGEATSIRLELAEAKGAVNVRNIQQLNLFLWKPRSNATVIIDDVRLEPKGKGTTASPAGSPAASARRADLAARMSQTPHQLDAARFAASIGRWQHAGPAGTPVVRVPLLAVSEGTEVSSVWPIAGGVPFPMGQLRPDATLRLSDANGQSFPLQWRPLATWQDGSIRWALVDTQGAVMPGVPAELFLDYGAGLVQPPPASSLNVTQDDQAVTVTTGPLRFSVSKQQFDLFHEAWLDRNADGVFAPEERVSAAGDLSVTHRGRRYQSSLDATTYTLTVEEQGELKTTLRAEGWFRDPQGNGFCQFIVRLQAFAGSSSVRLYHTFIYTGYPENTLHFKYREVRLPKNETIEDIALDLPVAQLRPDRVLSGEDGAVRQQPLGDRVEWLQLAAHEFTVNAPQQPLAQGKHLDGWIDALGPDAGVLVAVRDAWQQFPKGFTFDPQRGVITVQLWPREAGELDLRTTDKTKGPDDVARGSAFGLGKTHELLINFHPASAGVEDAARLARTFQEPPQLTAHPQWLAATSALGSFAPYDPQRSPDAEGLLEGLFGWAERQPRHFNWYGMLDFGDTLSWYRRDAYDKSYGEWGWHPEGRWGWMNSEGIGNHTAILMQFLRTAQPKYFRYADRATRHIMDVDTVHYNTIANDPRLRNTISDEYSRVGSMHRHSGDHWGGRNEETSHTSLTGFLLHYYATGYQRAFDVAKEVGDFFLEGRVTYSEHPDIAPQRSVSLPLWGLVQMYEATWDKRYLEGAERWAQILLKGQLEDGSWSDPYDPTTGEWRGKSNTRFMAFQTLPALIAYHRLTGSVAAGEAIVRGTDYCIAHEKYLPFFDAVAYSYQLTGNPRYVEFGDQRLRELIRLQNHSGDPLWEGMVFNKAYYERIFPVLSTVPAFLGASEATPLKSATTTAPIPTPAPASAPKPQANAPETIPGLEVSVVPSLEKVFPDRAPQHKAKNPARFFAARNEYESLQLLVQSPQALRGLRMESEDLVRTDGQGRIEKRHLTWRRVGYVKTQKPGYQVERVGLWPDPLIEAKSIDVAAGASQTLWLTLYVPEGTAAGSYRGTVWIRDEAGHATPVAVETRVWDFALPKVPSLKTAFDLYPGRLKQAYEQYLPEASARWKDRWPELEDRYYRAMLTYRLAPILNADLTDPRERARVGALLNEGMSAFGIGSHSGSHDNNWPKEPEALAALEPDYRALAAVLKEQGWTDRAYIYTYDEPRIGKARVLDVAQMIRRADPSLRNLVTLHTVEPLSEPPPWFEPLDIVVFRNVAFDPSLAEALRRQRKELWLYVSGPEPPYPTLVIDYPAMAARILPWMCWKYRLTGLLYWCVNFWTTNPWEQPMNTKWDQNGNGSLFYPGPEGPVASIRLEVLRDGMEDYEYLQRLAEVVASAKSTGSQPAVLIQQAEALLAVDPSLVDSMRTYTKDPLVLERNRIAIAEMIEKLQ